MKFTVETTGMTRRDENRNREYRLLNKFVYQHLNRNHI